MGARFRFKCSHCQGNIMGAELADNVQKAVHLLETQTPGLPMTLKDFFCAEDAS
jgi:hypothetical protein